MKVFIINYKRTPIGSFQGSLSKLSAIELAKDIVDDITKNINKNDIELAYFGNVLSSGLGQNICKQITYNSKINCPSITLNRVCGSSMQAIIEGFKTIKLGDAKLVLVGGTESMSNSPHFSNIRNGKKFGNISLKDTMLIDGLTDPLTNKHMGELTEELLNKININRNEMDYYTKKSYENARNAIIKSKFENEILPLEVNINKKKIIIKDDEEINKIPNLSKINMLKSVFVKDGKITAGNASKLSDGASVLLLANEEYIKKNNVSPLCEIVDYNLTELEPIKFSLAPIDSIKRILLKNKLKTTDIDFFEVNEAFAHIPIVLHKDLNIPYDKINIYGGAVSLGHPIGESGSRIVCTLLSSLINENKKLGCASICNGGGGASTIILKR